MSNSLNDLLKSINKEKLAELKKKAENGDLSQMLGAVDTEKAQQMIKQMGLEEKAKNVDLGKLLQEIQKNPDVLNTLKKML